MSKGNKITAIEFNQKRILLAIGEVFSSGSRLVSLESVDVQQGVADSLIATLKEICEKNSLKGTTFISIIPRYQVFVKR